MYILLLRLFLFLFGMLSTFQECQAQSSIYLDCGGGNKEYELPVYAKMEVWHNKNTYLFETIIEAASSDSILCAEYKNRANMKVIPINQIRKITFLKNPSTSGSGMAIGVLSGVGLVSAGIGIVSPVLGGAVMMIGLTGFTISASNNENSFYMKNCQIIPSPD